MELPKVGEKVCSAVVYLGDDVAAQWVILKVVWKEDSSAYNWDLRKAFGMVEHWDL